MKIEDIERAQELVGQLRTADAELAQVNGLEPVRCVVHMEGPAYTYPLRIDMPLPDKGQVVKSLKFHRNEIAENLRSLGVEVEDN